MIYDDNVVFQFLRTSKRKITIFYAWTFAGTQRSCINIGSVNVNAIKFVTNTHTLFISFHLKKKKRRAVTECVARLNHTLPIKLKNVQHRKIYLKIPRVQNTAHTDHLKIPRVWNTGHTAHLKIPRVWNIGHTDQLVTCSISVTHWTLIPSMMQIHWTVFKIQDQIPSQHYWDHV